VKTGVPLFLRDLNKESEFQAKADIREMWMFAAKLLARDGEMYSMLSKRLTEQKTTFVYFIDAKSGEQPFRALRDKLLSEGHQAKDITARLKCILTPSTCCIFHFAICNPSDDFEKMFGRAVSYRRCADRIRWDGLATSENCV
jgi:hypothetical protein